MEVIEFLELYSGRKLKEYQREMIKREIDKKFSEEHYNNICVNMQRYANKIINKYLEE